MYKVYVGCLPASCTAELLAEFFSQHGRIVDAKVTKKPGSKLCSGNGTIECLDKETLDTIIATREFKFHGRIIYCEGKLNGEDLILKNLSLSRRRVFVSNLPPGATDEQLEDIMRGFGAVQNCYRIKTLTQKPRPFGFVTFCDEISAGKAIEAGFVVINGQFVYISPFKKNSSNKQEKDQGNNPESGISGLNAPSSAQNDPKSPESGSNTKAKLILTPNIKSRLMKEDHAIKPSLVRYYHGWVGPDHGESSVRFNVYIPIDLLWPMLQDTGNQTVQSSSILLGKPRSVNP